MVAEMVFNQNKNSMYSELGFPTKKYSLALKIVHSGLIGGVVLMASALINQLRNYTTGHFLQY